MDLNTIKYDVILYTCVYNISTRFVSLYTIIYIYI
jgi:hypothetical protein